ncbi:MAG TPA: DUF3618 domain-containing protein [Longimicrobiaceae bacterium]|nr:DUF3618 domain-containing protein [Longimicrobiaceae bacterium]
MTVEGPAIIVTADEGQRGANSTVAIEEEIQRTRERMGQTVEALGKRLNPDRLKHEVRQNIREATIGKVENMARIAADRVDETGHSLMDNIRENPIPAAMVGIGLGWLLMNGRRHEKHHGRHRGGFEREFGYGPGYTDLETGPYDHDRSAHGGARGHREEFSGERGKVGQVAERASDLRDSAVDKGEEMVDRAQARMTDVAHDVRDTARDMADRAQDTFETAGRRARSMANDFTRDTRRGAHRVEDRFEEAIQTSPLAVGAAAVALGMAVGLSAPATRREVGLIGSRRDELMDQAEETTREMAGRARDVADRVVHETESTVRDVIQEEGLS